MGLELDTAVYTWETTPRSTDVDATRQISLSAILKLQQEIGDMHTREIGLSYERLYEESGVIFILTRLNCKIYRRPRMGEKIKITTWCRGIKGIQFYRCYRFETPDGELLIDNVGMVAVVDSKEHKLVRPQSVPLFKLFVYTDELVSTCDTPRKLFLGECWEREYKRPIFYSDTDYNGHLNNTIYAEFISDYIPGGMSDKEIKGFSISFQAEAFPGESVTINVRGEENTAFYSGKHKRGACFEAVCYF
ncbi:MAG: thioesterase [Oscillospiraceae bacterium]